MPPEKGEPESAGGSGRAQGVCRRLFLAEKKELRSGKEIEVLALGIGDYDRLPRFLRQLPALEDTVSFFNCDLPLGQYYLYSRGIFPLGALRRGMRRRKTAEAIQPLESPWNEAYILPDLSVMEISLEGSHLLPFGKGNALSVRIDGQSRVFEPESPEATAPGADRASCSVMTRISS